MSNYPDQIKEQIKGVIGEHYTNYAVVLLEEDGELHIDYPSPIIGKALLAEGLKVLIELDRNQIIFYDTLENQEEDDIDEQ